MQDFFLQKSNGGTAQAVTCEGMARRAVPRAPKSLGDQLLALRLAFSENRNRRSREAIVNLLKTHGVDIDQSSLFRYEMKRHMPTVDVLWGLSLVYREPFANLLALALSGIDPAYDQLIQTRGQPSELGGGDDFTSSRPGNRSAHALRQARQELADYKRHIERMLKEMVRTVSARGARGSDGPRRRSSR